MFFVAAAAFISPRGNFPLNDDWMYSFAVQRFMETGKFEFVGPNCTSCLLHVVAGAALCKPFGFSHEVLRLFTLVLGCLNSIGVYLLIREFRVTRKLATLAALTYAGNPIFLNLVFSYMTDVASMTLATFSTLFTVRAIKRNSAIRFNFAGVLLLAAIAVRQTNVAMVGANLCLLLYYWAKRKHSWSVLISLVVLPAIWFKLVDKVVPVSLNHPMAYGWYQNHVNGIFTSLIKTPLIGLYSLAIHLGETCFYLSLVLLPLIVALTPCLFDLVRSRIRIWGAWFIFGATIAVATAMKFVIQSQSYMPFSQNLLRVPVIGSLAIVGINLPTLAKPWRLSITHYCAIGTTLLLAVFLSGIHRVVIRLFSTMRQKFSTVTTENSERRALSAAVCFATAGCLLGLTVVQSSINDLDRYYIIPSAVLLCCLTLSMRWLRIKPIWLLVLPTFVALSVYSICAEQDYMSWNRARWDAAHWLEAKGVSPSSIDGGAEYDFDHNHLLYNTRFKGAEPYCHWRWWSITGEQYIISFSPVPGYEEVASQRYWSALTPFKQRELFILKKSPG